jgi:hypothetical protein
MNTTQNAESVEAQNSSETAPEIRVASSPQTSDPPPTAEQQQQDQKNPTLNTPQSEETPAAAQPPETSPSLSVAPALLNGPAPAMPGEQDQEQDQEQETGKVDTGQNAESGTAAPTPPAAPAQQQGLENQALVLSPVLGSVETLTASEQADLWSYEEVLGSGSQSFAQEGLALAQIRDRRLYKVDFDSFEDYCRLKWQYSRRYVDQLIAAAQLFRYLSANCAERKPEHENQLRPLVGLTPEQAQAAWESATEKASGRKTTAQMVKSAVNKLGLGPQKQSGSVRTPQSERRVLISRTMSELLKLISDKADHDVLLEKARALESHLNPILGKK